MHCIHPLCSAASVSPVSDADAYKFVADVVAFITGVPLKAASGSKAAEGLGWPGTLTMSHATCASCGIVIVPATRLCPGRYKDGKDTSVSARDFECYHDGTPPSAPVDKALPVRASKIVGCPHDWSCKVACVLRDGEYEFRVRFPLLKHDYAAHFCDDTIAEANKALLPTAHPNALDMLKTLVWR